MTALVETSWLQKHPSPRARDGSFHWYSDRESEVSAVVDRFFAGSYQHPRVLLWSNAGVLWWVRTFETVLTTEQRRYTGLVVQRASARPGVGVLQLVKCLDSSPARPWIDGAGSTGPRELEPLASSFGNEDLALAAQVLACPSACVRTSQPALEGLVSALPTLAPWLKDVEVRLARGLGAARQGTVLQSGPRTLAHYLGQVAAPDDDPRLSEQTWALIGDIAACHQWTLEQTFAELAALASAWQGPAELMALLESRIFGPGHPGSAGRTAPAPLWRPGLADAGALWNRVINYWGRGFLPAELGSGLADLLVLRVAVDHLYRLEHADGASPMRYLRRLRWEAVLPSGQTRAMLALVSERAPSLALADESF